MRFGVLGPFEVVDDQGRGLALGGYKQRAVLAILLVHANEVVSTERLIDALWGEHPPGSAAKTIQVYVSNLRKALGDGVIDTRGRGYLLRADPGEVDAGRFRTLAGEGADRLSAGDPASAAAVLREALGLCRGPPLADFAGESFAQGEITRLEEARLAALEERLDADLALGEHAVLVGELQALAHEHPLRERLRGQLMLALYRAGRQSDALAVYRELSRLLREELGLEPSPPLQALELAILQRDPSLEPRSRRSCTILLTDLDVGLSEQRPELREAALERHDAVVRDAVEASHGQVVKTTGDGVMVALFASPVDGVGACVAAQQRFGQEPLGEIGVRMALHVGEAAMRAGGPFGPTLSRAERILSAAHARQILLSAAVAARVANEPVNGYTLRDLGEHQLKESGPAERVFQLVHPALEVDFPPLVTRPRRGGNLPEPASSFVGRSAELREVSELLEDESVRLLTLAGPGGVGKTRLALRAAAAQLDRFDGVFFVDLGAVRTSREALAAIGEVIGVRDVGSESLRDKLVGRLNRQRALVLLDNFEHVIAAAGAVADLFRDCSRLKLLVTSREALRVSPEHLFSVPPLSLPRVPAGRASVEQLAGSEAVQLFVKRAKAVKHTFRLTDGNAADVADICLRVDGLPLAIELATARINLLSPEALRVRLGNRLQLLRSGPRDAPARQRTLRATLDWSYGLLRPTEQRLFALLSAFSGAGFEAIEAVVTSVTPDCGTGIDIVDGLVSLMDKNLIRLAESGDGEPRVDMLETMREYATERLDDLPELSAAVRRAHAVYFGAFARAHWEHLIGDGRAAALAALGANTENLRLAWRYWVAAGDLGQLEALAHSLWMLYDARGWYEATVELAHELLNVLSSTPPTAQRALQEVTLRTGLARALLAHHGYTYEVEQAYIRAVELFEGGQQPPQLFPVLRGLASLYNLRGEFAKGAQVGRAILGLADAQDDASMRVDGHLVIGSSLAMHDDLHGGLEHLDVAIAGFESHHRPSRFTLGNNPGVAALTTSALTLWMLGYPDRALARGDRAVASASELEHPFTLGYALFHTGVLHLWRREPELVRDRAVSTLDVADEHDLRIWRALGFCLLGAAQAALGGSEDGLAEIREGVQMYRRLRTPPAFWALVLFLHASACAQSGRPAEGLGLLDQATAVVADAFEQAGPGAGTTLLPEFHLLKGNLLLSLDKADDGEPWLMEAFRTARELDARLPQLRAATALCHAQARRGDAERARELLSTTYATFTEGFATRDLLEAQALLRADR